MVKCPYCKEEIDGWAIEYGGPPYDSGYGEDVYGDGTYWDEFHCECPHCGKEFRWFENYVRVEDDAFRMDD